MTMAISFPFSDAFLQSKKWHKYTVLFSMRNVESWDKAFSMTTVRIKWAIRISRIDVSVSDNSWQSGIQDLRTIQSE